MRVLKEKKMEEKEKRKKNERTPKPPPKIECEGKRVCSVTRQRRTKTKMQI